MSYPFILQGDNIVIVIDGEPHTINKTHITYTKIVDAINTFASNTLNTFTEKINF